MSTVESSCGKCHSYLHQYHHLYVGSCSYCTSISSLKLPFQRDGPKKSKNRSSIARNQDFQITSQKTMTSTIALFVHQHLVIPMTNPAFIVPAVIISCIVVLATIFFSNKKTRKPLPPLIKDGMFKFVQEMQTSHNPQYINRCSRELNASVFRLPVPELNPFIMVASPTLARTILEGDKSKGIVESDKSHHYGAFQKLFDLAPAFGFSKTETERWRQGRKGVAPAFSTSNIFRQFPRIIKGVNQFHDILSKHAAEGKPVEDLAAWLNRLIFDILGSGMFQVEFNLLTGERTVLIIHMSVLFITSTSHYLLRLRWRNRRRERFPK